MFLLCGGFSIGGAVVCGGGGGGVGVCVVGGVCWCLKMSCMHVSAMARMCWCSGCPAMSFSRRVSAVAASPSCACVCVCWKLIGYRLSIDVIIAATRFSRRRLFRSVLRVGFAVAWRVGGSSSSCESSPSDSSLHESGRG